MIGYLSEYTADSYYENAMDLETLYHLIILALMEYTYTVLNHWYVFQYLA